MQKLRNIKVGGVVKYSIEYDDSAEADAWYAMMQAKQEGNFLPEHTVEDIDNPEVAKRLLFREKLEKIKDPDIVVAKTAIYEILSFLGKDHFDE